jgi:ABC-2 type transport system ATP-binding protein
MRSDSGSAAATEPILAIHELESTLPQGKRLWYFKSGSLRCNGVHLLLGRNGSGKSSLLRTLLGIQKAHSGTFVWNSALNKLSDIAYLPELPVLTSAVRVDEWICWYNGISERSLRSEMPLLLNDGRLSINDLFHLQISKLSKGQLQKVQIWQSMFRNPKVVFLDEPFSGLDPWHKKELVSLFLELSKNSSLLISTHEIPEEFRGNNTKAWLIDQNKEISEVWAKDLVISC